MPPGLLSSEFDVSSWLIELVDTNEGGSEWLGKRRSPAGDSRGGWWVSERSSFSAQSPLGAKILPVEHTIRRWRVGTGQHASETTCG